MADRLWKDRELGAPGPEEMFRMADQAYPESRFNAEEFTKVPNGGKVDVKGREFFVLDRVENSKTGLDAYLITDDKRSFAVVAYRGSDLAVGNPDVGADLEFLALQVPEQARLASETFRRWRDKYGTIHKWGVTGHSLGGIDVQYALAMNGDDIDWAYNFSGPNLYPSLARHEKEAARRHGDKLYSLGGEGDLIFNFIPWSRGHYVGYMSYMDFENPSNHDIGKQFRFDDEGNPVLADWLEPQLDRLLEQEFGLGGTTWNVSIAINEPTLSRAMRGQLSLQQHIEAARKHNGEVFAEMQEEFEKVVARFSMVEGVRAEDVRQVVDECGLWPEKNVDQAALGQVAKNMAGLAEENARLVKAVAKVAKGRIDADRKAAGEFNPRKFGAR